MEKNGINYDKNYEKFVFYVDINGAKKPNRMGYDVFAFSEYLPRSGGNCDNPPDGSNEWCNRGNRLYCGGSGDHEKWFRNNQMGCSGDGLNCSCPIMINGFKIPDNYPVKWF